MARNASATRSPSGTSPTSVVGSPRRRHPSRTCKRCLFSNSESADGALDAYGIGLDPTSLDLARSYQLDVWDRIGSCTLTGARHDDGSHHLTVVTPHSQTRHLAPALDRDQRSAAFGPPTPLAWGAGGAGSLETARCVLDYTGSTTRTPQQLFDDARALAITSVQRWPPNFAVEIADIHQWATTRNPIAHRVIDGPGATTEAATAAVTRRPPRQRPSQSTQWPTPTRQPQQRRRPLARVMT